VKIIAQILSAELSLPLKATSASRMVQIRELENVHLQNFPEEEETTKAGMAMVSAEFPEKHYLAEGNE